MANDSRLAMATFRCQHVDRTFKGVELVTLVTHFNPEATVISISAVTAGPHNHLPKV